MQKIWSKWTGLSMRNRLLMLFFFILAFCGNIHTRWSKSLTYFFLVPVMIYLALQQYRDKLVRRTPVLLVSVVCVLWAFCNYMINDIWTTKGIVSLWGMAIAWLYVLFMPRNMDADEIHKQIFSIGCVFIFCFLPVMLIAIVSIFTGKTFYVPGNADPVGIQIAGQVNSRIRVMMNPNYMGRITAYNMLFSLYAIVTRRKAWVRALFAGTLLVNLIIFVHGQSRTSYISLALAIGILAFRAVVLLLHNRRAMRFVLGFIALVVVFFIVLEGFSVILDIDVAIAKRTSMVEMPVQDAQSRVEIYGKFDATSSGRGVIWTAVFNYLKNNPRVLITGMGTENVMEIISADDPSVVGMAHPHSVYLDVLCRGGIPFLLLVLVFLCMMVPPCWRMIIQPGNKANKGLFVVPVFIAMMLVMGVAEVFLFVGLDYGNVLFMAMCGYALHYTALEKEGRLTA